MQPRTEVNIKQKYNFNSVLEDPRIKAILPENANGQINVILFKDPAIALKRFYTLASAKDLSVISLIGEKRATECKRVKKGTGASGLLGKFKSVQNNLGIREVIIYAEILIKPSYAPYRVTDEANQFSLETKELPEVLKQYLIELILFSYINDGKSSKSLFNGLQRIISNTNRVIAIKSASVNSNSGAAVLSDNVNDTHLNNNNNNNSAGAPVPPDNINYTYLNSNIIDISENTETHINNSNNNNSNNNNSNANIGGVIGISEYYHTQNVSGDETESDDEFKKSSINLNNNNISTNQSAPTAKYSPAPTAKYYSAMQTKFATPFIPIETVTQIGGTVTNVARQPTTGSANLTSETTVTQVGGTVANVASQPITSAANLMSKTTVTQVGGTVANVASQPITSAANLMSKTTVTQIGGTVENVGSQPTTSSANNTPTNANSNISNLQAALKLKYKLASTVMTPSQWLANRSALMNNSKVARNQPSKDPENNVTINSSSNQKEVIEHTQVTFNSQTMQTNATFFANPKESNKRQKIVTVSNYEAQNTQNSTIANGSNALFSNITLIPSIGDQPRINISSNTPSNINQNEALKPVECNVLSTSSLSK